MIHDHVKLDLSLMPDAFGFFYGSATRGVDYHTINVLPPLPQWKGQYELDGFEPDENDWILYVDGEEIARVKDHGQVEMTLRQALLVG